MGILHNLVLEKMELVSDPCPRKTLLTFSFHPIILKYSIYIPLINYSLAPSKPARKQKQSCELYIIRHDK